VTIAADAGRLEGLTRPDFRSEPGPPLSWIAFAAALAAGSYLLARYVGLGPPQGPWAYWPMQGIMVGILFRRPAREWPPIILVAAAAQVSTIYLARGDLAGGATPVGALAGFVQAALSVAILRRRPSDSYLLDTPRDLAWFVTVAVVLVPLAVTPLTAMAYAAGLGLPYTAVWAPLFAGNSLSVLLFAPPFFARRSAAHAPRPWQAGPAEVLLCQAATVGLAVFTFAGPDGWVRFVALPYSLFPILAWSALRCGPRATALAIIAIATVGAWCTAHGLGPFGSAAFELNRRVLGVQAYLAVLSLTGLVLTALTEERLHSFAELSLRDAIRNAFLESSGDVLALSEADGRFVVMNPAAREAYATAGADPVGFHPRELLPADQAETIEAHVRRVRERGEALAFRETLGRGDAARPFAVTRFPVRDHTGAVRYVGMIARDDSLERELSSRLEGAQRVEVLGRLAAGVAHDLNNLLMVVVGYTRLLLEEPGRPADESAMLRDMSTAGHKAVKLSNRLMALGRGRPAAAGGVVDVDPVIRELDPLLRVLARGSVDVLTRLGAPGARVRIDPTALEQIVLNLVSNARDAIEGEGRITVTTGTVARDRRRWLRLAVADTGSGMDRATLGRVFEPFFTTKADRGTGIGLYTVAAIVRQAGGEITASSEPGAGTTFVVDLPAVPTEDDGGGDRSSTPAGSA